MKYSIYTLILFAGIFFSCTNDDSGGSGKVTGSEDISVTFTVRMPAQTSSSSTYAMDDDAENYVETIDVLAFKQEADGKEYFLYHAKGTSINQNAGGSNLKEFTVNLIKKNFPQRFVVIINARAQLEALGEIQTTGVKEEVLERLLVKNVNAWDATSNEQFKPFPMWGETDVLETINDATTELSDVIKVLRMVARIDVLIDSDAEGDFKLETVALYNRKTRGHVVPSTDNDKWDASNKKAIKPTIPADDDPSTDLNILGPLRYTTPSVKDSAFIQTIYTFESAAADKDKASQATCIVVGGKFEDDTQTTYYRIDFMNTDKNDEFESYKHILRNHLYRVNITEIAGRGYPTEDDAFNSKPMNMKFYVREWDQGDYGNVVFDGQYLLAVDPGIFNLTREAQEDLEIKVFTDHPGGWKGEVAADGVSWLTLTSPNPVTGVADVDGIVAFKVTANDTDATRVTRIKFTAGRLTYNVEVKQTLDNAFGIRVLENNIEITELIFPSMADLPYADIEHDIVVKWDPASSQCLVSTTNIENVFSYANNTDPTTNGNNILSGGSQPLTLRAAEMTVAERNATPFLSKVERMDFTVNDNGSYKMKSVFLRQVNYTVVPSAVEHSCTMDGEEYSFTVKSNALWDAAVKENSDTKGIITRIVTPSGGNNTDTGETFSIKLLDDKEGDIGTATATIVFTSPEGKFHPVEVVINGKSPVQAEPKGKANSYIVKPGVPIIFPVDQANADQTTRIDASTKLKLELLWTDSSNGLASNGVVSSYQLVGDGSTAEIIVVPGSSYGNAVIAARGVDDNEIKWSWHIWNVDYDPDNGGTTYLNQGYTFMDRNLGAISITPADVKSKGLFYQFGRKDPFPGAASTTGNNFTTIYDENRNILNIAPQTAPTGTDNTNAAVKNPMVFYTGGNSNDWVSSSTTWSNSTIWGHDPDSHLPKTAYDPCPYGWRVPASGYGYVGSAFAELQNHGNYSFSNYTATWSNETFGNWPATGYKDGANLINITTTGYYWSRTANWSTSNGVTFGSNAQIYVDTNRNRGLAVRCIKDNK